MAKYHKILEPGETNFDADEQWVFPLPFYHGWNIAGNARNNNLAGSSGWIISNDIIYGYDGNDKLDGKYGDDRLYGGNDNDRLYGRDGDDRLYGEDDNDRLYGGNGIDHLYGGDDDDYLNGGNDIDHLYGGDGDDSLNGGSGNDVMEGGLGDDYYTVDNFSDVVIENSNADNSERSQKLVEGWNPQKVEMKMLLSVMSANRILALTGL